MKRLFILVALLLFQFSNAQFQESLIDSLAKKVLAETRTIGAYVSISKQESSLISSAYGYNDLEEKSILTDSSIFPISSNTKAFNAILLSQLAEKNRLDFYEPVKSYLPDLEFKDDYITENVKLSIF